MSIIKRVWGSGGGARGSHESMSILKRGKGEERDGDHVVAHFFEDLPKVIWKHNIS